MFAPILLLSLLSILRLALSQCDSEAYCYSLFNQDKIYIANNEKREVILSDYIVGFNLTYSINLSQPNSSSKVSLNVKLNESSQLTINCSQ